MTRATFETHLREASRAALSFARTLVRQTIPDAVGYVVYPNQSFDGNPLREDEEVFPSDSLPGREHHGPWPFADVVAFLWREGKVPEWIDLKVAAVEDTHTIIALDCCDRFTATDELLYYRRPGELPPFGIKSPSLPPGWRSVAEDGPFDLEWRARTGGGRGWWKWW